MGRGCDETESFGRTATHCVASAPKARLDWLCVAQGGEEPVRGRIDHTEPSTLAEARHKKKRHFRAALGIRRALWLWVSPNQAAGEVEVDNLSSSGLS